MDPTAVSPRTTSISPLATAQQQQPAAPAASTSSSSSSTPVSPASARTHALLASFAGLSPTREPTADSPTFLAQPFTPSAVLGKTRSFRPRQAKPRAPPPPPSLSSSSKPADTAPTSPGTTKKARRRRSSAASNPKFHSQPRARRSSHTPPSARSASFALSPRTPTEFGAFTPGSPSSFPPSPGTSSSASWALAPADTRPPRKSSLHQAPPAPSPRPSPSKRATPRKAPPPEIFILNATPAAARQLDLHRSPSTASVQSARSDWALSLGAFETLPVGFHLQPSPPTSPGVSPTAAGFPAGSTAGACSRPRTSRLNSASSLSIDRQLYLPARTPLASARRRSYTSPMRQAQLRAGASLPASPQLGAGKAVVEKGQQRALAARDKEQAKREKERRRIVEQARPLPYTKKVEIDEFLGNLPAKAKKTRQPGSKDVSWRGESAGRNVGSGRKTEHVTEDGNVWLDVEEEQEWAWLLSEVGKGGQPLPNWPQQFTSHLRRTSDAPRGRGLGPAGGRGAELEWTIQEIIQDTAYAADDGDLDAWLGDAPEKLVSVFNLKKDSTVRAGSPTGRSDGGASDLSGKRRPRALQAFGSISSSSSLDRPATPPLVASLDLEALQAHGKSDFLASTFAPTSPTPSLATLPPSPVTPTDEPEAAVQPTTKPRSNSCKSEKPVKASKPATGALGKMRGFLRKVGKDAAAAA